MKVNELLNIKGKVAIVTGASSGLGVTFSEALAEEGANLVLAARRIEKLTEVAHNLEKLGIKAVPFQCDVTKQEEVQALIDASVKNFGRIDIIVNNAGVAAMGPSREMPVEEWNKVVSRYLEYITKLTPLGRVGHPDDLKGAVLFLSSNASDFITGQTIFVDGGWTIW